MFTILSISWSRFVSVPQGMGAFNCGTFVAGIVKVKNYLIFWFRLTSLSLMRLFGGDSNSSLLVAIHLLSTQRVLLYCAGCVGWSWISCKSNSSFCSRGGPSTAPHYYPHKICWRGMSCAIILISKPKFEISIIDVWELKSHSHDSLHNVPNLSGPQTNIFSD